MKKLPNYLHAIGAILSIISGISSLPHNPGYVFNVAVFFLLGYEALPKKEPKDFPPSSKYDAISGAFHGVINSRNVKILFGVTLTTMAIWFLILGQNNAFIGTLVFDFGVWLSVIGSEIEKRSLKSYLKNLPK